MNLFDDLPTDRIAEYVAEIEEAMKRDTLVQNPDELGRWLCLLVEQPELPKVYVEIGVSAGGTFRLTHGILMAHATISRQPRLLCVAIDDGSDAGFQQFEQWFQGYDSSDCRLIRADVTLEEGRRSVGSSSFPAIDACMIDDGHTYECTMASFRLIEDRMRKGGLIAFHDTTDPRCPDVARAVRDIVAEGVWKQVAHHSVQFGLTVLGT